MSTNSRAERADLMPPEPRCRICRDPGLRRLVNDLLSNWHGIPVFPEGRRTRRVSYTEVLRKHGALGRHDPSGFADWLTVAP
jgi:hypothetical protein